MTRAQNRIADVGAVPQAAPVFAYVFRWNRMGRKGQRCALLTLSRNRFFCRVRFEDGFETILNRNAIVRADECKSPNGQEGGRGSCQSKVRGADVFSPTPHPTHSQKNTGALIHSTTPQKSLLSNSRREAAYEGNK